MSTDHEPVFACDMRAIDPADRPTHAAAIRELFRSVHTIRELPDGYAFGLPNETLLVRKVGEFIAYERLCCPFFGFTLTVEPDRRDVWLHLRGSEGIKPFILAEIGSALNPAVIRG